MTSLRQLLRDKMNNQNIRILTFCMETQISTQVLRRLLKGERVRMSTKERAVEWLQKRHHRNVLSIHENTKPGHPGLRITSTLSPSST